MIKTQVKTDGAPKPAGTYSQAIETSGTLIFISGQTPRTPDGVRLTDVPFETEVEQTMLNLQAVAEAAGGTLEANCVQVTVYLRDLEDRFVFDKVFARYVGSVPPARAIVQSNFTEFGVEVSAILSR